MITIQFFECTYSIIRFYSMGSEITYYNYVVADDMNMCHYVKLMQFSEIQFYCIQNLNIFSFCVSEI